VDRHHQPARLAVQLHPRRRLQRPDPRQEGRRDLHQRRLQPGAPLAYGNDFHAAFFNDWLRFAGFADVDEIRWQPTVVTAARDTDKAAAQQRAAEAGRRF
jgi:hypothetical protein